MLAPEEEADEEPEEPDAPEAADDSAGSEVPGGDEHLFDARTPIPIQESIDVAVPVAAAFELPVAAKVLAQTKRFAAVICLGCVIRGDTPHFDYVAGECARGIMDVSLSESLPVG